MRRRAANHSEIFTIGHSNHPIERFIALLRGASVETLVDVRSIPASRFCPQFRRERLDQSLQAAGIAYHWRGEMLGGKPKDKKLWRDGTPDYVKIAAQPEFVRAIEDLVHESAKVRLVIMCAEKAPLDCHRTLLLGPPLEQRGITLRHILADGTIKTHEAIAGGADDLFARAESKR